MSTCNWSAIVYARTYEVDFRFIAIPERFSDDDINDIEPYILTSTRFAEELPKQWRWSLFRNERQCVFGVTCMASDLIEAAGPVGADWIEMTCDNTRVRRLYLFAGYVSNQGLAIVPTFDKLDLSIFAPLYQYVAQCWLVKPYEELSRTTIKIPYEQPKWTIQKSNILDKENSNISVLLTDLFKTGEVCLIPDADEPRKLEIWNAVAHKAVETSICFGLRRERDVLDSRLVIASLPIEKEIKRKRRLNDLSFQSAEPSPNNSEQVKPISDGKIEDKSQTECTHNDNIDHDKKEYQKNTLIQRANKIINSARQLTNDMLDFVSPRKQTQNNKPVAPPTEFLKKSADQGDSSEKKKTNYQSPWDLD